MPLLCVSHQLHAPGAGAATVTRRMSAAEQHTTTCSFALTLLASLKWAPLAVHCVTEGLIQQYLVVAPGGRSRPGSKLGEIAYTLPD